MASGSVKRKYEELGVLIDACFNEILTCDEKAINIKKFLDAGYNLRTKAIIPCCSDPDHAHNEMFLTSESLETLLIYANNISPAMIDFAIKNGVLVKNNMQFLLEFVNFIHSYDRWPVIHHLIANVYDIDMVTRWKCPDNHTIIWYAMTSIFHHNSEWALKIAKLAVEHKFNFAEKNGPFGLTMLDLAVSQYDVALINYCIEQKCSFADGGLFENRGVVNKFNDPRFRTKYENKTIVTGCDAIKSIVWYAYKDSDNPPYLHWQEKIYKIVELCIKKGYNAKAKDLHGHNFVDYINKYIPAFLYPEYHAKYIKLCS